MYFPTADLGFKRYSWTYRSAQFDMSDNYFLNRIIVTTQLNTIILITKRFALEIKVNFHVNSYFLIIFRNVTNPNVFWNVFLSVDICFPCKTTDPFKAKNIFFHFFN